MTSQTIKNNHNLSSKNAALEQRVLSQALAIEELRARCKALRDANNVLRKKCEELQVIKEWSGTIQHGGL